MLSPGHIAAGYLVTKILLRTTDPTFNYWQVNNLLLWGAFFGFAPDLDISYTIFHPAKKTMCLTRCHDTNSHRNYITHAPLIWFFVGLLVFLFGATTFIKYVGVLIWLGSWSHFVLDSFDDGIRWLYPFSKKFFVIRNNHFFISTAQKGFLRDFQHFLKHYINKFKLTFYLEVILIITTLIVYFFHL